MEPTKPTKNRGVALSNARRTRHGLRGTKLPKGCRQIENRGYKLRADLEDACIAARGEVRLQDAAIIQTCVRWEQHGLLAARWLRLEGNDMSASDRLRFSEAVAKASAERDRAIGKLNLDRPSDDPWGNVLPARLDHEKPDPTDTQSVVLDDASDDCETPSL